MVIGYNCKLESLCWLTMVFVYSKLNGNVIELLFWGDGRIAIYVESLFF